MTLPDKSTAGKTEEREGLTSKVFFFRFSGKMIRYWFFYLLEM